MSNIGPGRLGSISPITEPPTKERNRQPPPDARKRRPPLNPQVPEVDQEQQETDESNHQLDELA
jgi:hypothetical protein